MAAPPAPRAKLREYRGMGNAFAGKTELPEVVLEWANEP